MATTLHHCGERVITSGSKIGHSHRRGFSSRIAKDKPQEAVIAAGDGTYNDDGPSSRST